MPVRGHRRRVCAVDAGDGSGTQYDPEFTLDNGGGYSEPVYRVIVEEGQKDQLKPDRSTATLPVRL